MIERAGPRDRPAPYGERQRREAERPTYSLTARGREIDMPPSARGRRERPGRPPCAPPLSAQVVGDAWAAGREGVWRVSPLYLLDCIRC